MKKVAILGYGTVGKGVFKVLTQNSAVVAKNAGEEIQVKYVVDLLDFPGDPVEPYLTHDFNDVVTDPEVDIVVETMGGLRAAYAFTKASLEAGKSACTSNKELVAAYGLELLNTAKEHGANYLFEASCGGGIPIIRPLMTSITGDEILEITGILNGTTNYILTQMTENGMDFDTALKGAQANGFAELHPEADIEGYDPCRKIAILSEIAYGKAVDFNDIYCEGITKITAEDIEYAKKLGARIKLLASSVKRGEAYKMMVAPYLIGPENPLYSVNGVFNAVFVEGNMLGDSMFYGSGAGSLPTASAVVGDIIDLAKNTDRCIMKIWDEEKLPLVPHKDAVNKFFIRIKAEDLQKASELFAIEKTVKDVFSGEIGIITAATSEGEFAEQIEKIDAISYIRARI